LKYIITQGAIYEKKCLLILPRKIFPVIGGYAVKGAALAQILHKYFELTIVIISDTKITADEKIFLKARSSSLEYITFPKWRYLWNAFCAVFSKEPIQVGYFYFKKVQRIIDKILPAQDIAVGALIRSMKYLKNAPHLKIVNGMEDSIGLNYKNSKDSTTSFFWSLLYKIEADRLLKYEKYWLKNAFVTMLVNITEYDYLKQFGNARLIQNGVNDKLLSYNGDYDENQYSKSVAFFGKMDYQPNIEAVKWYVKNVHSKIGDKIPFIIVGAFPAKEILNLAKKYKNISVTGFLDDPYKILHSSLAVAAPMQTGAGIQNKVLETLALGTINLLTPLAAAPIVGGEDKKHFFVLQTGEDFCNKILDISSNPRKYETIKSNARDFISRNYTWHIYEKKYMESIL
jgi:glycosyltransferase involved in cell wall biosynthesis